MDPAEKPGSSQPRGQDDLTQPVDEAEVEKKLDHLESAASTLVEEVGRADPADAAGEEESLDATGPEPLMDDAAESAPTDAAPVRLADRRAGGRATDGGADTPVSAETEPVADDEVEQEIKQAIKQLQAGKPAAPEAKGEPKPGGTPVRSALRRLLGPLGRVVGLALTPLTLIAIVADMPFRWVPEFIKQLLGYVAVGTALMVVALWVYILMCATG